MFLLIHLYIYISLLIKTPNKQKTTLLFLRFSILSLSKILSYTLDLQVNKILFAYFGAIFLKRFKYINNYLNYNIKIEQTLKRSSQPEVLSKKNCCKSMQHIRRNRRKQSEVSVNLHCKLTKTAL